MEWKDTHNVTPAGTVEAAPPARRRSGAKKYAIGAGLLVTAFLLGFVPSWIAARDAREDRVAMQARLGVAEIKVQLGNVAFEASRNNFASARTMSTQFFDRVRSVAEATPSPALRRELEAALARRDEITAGLSQADPAVKEKLAQMYVDFPDLVGGK